MTLRRSAGNGLASHTSLWLLFQSSHHSFCAPIMRVQIHLGRNNAFWKQTKKGYSFYLFKDAQLILITIRIFKKYWLEMLARPYPIIPHIREHKQSMQMKHSPLTIIHSICASDQAHLNHF